MLSFGRQERINLEQLVISIEMSQFKFVRTSDEECFEGWSATSTGNKYKLKLKLPQNYPDQCPLLYVESPHILKKYGGGTINEIGSSHAFHINTPGPNGCVQICHFTRETWDASRTAVQVLAMGHLWLECHSLHLMTGETIDEIADKLKKRRNARSASVHWMELDLWPDLLYKHNMEHFKLPFKLGSSSF